MVPPSDGPRSGSFATTPWSLLFAFRHAESPTKTQAALSHLCEIYWGPIFLFIRSQGYELHDAQDLTQSFMVYLIERGSFGKADQSKGKFRSYVLGTLKHFLAHAWRDQRAQKRGGGADTVSLDDAVATESEAPEARLDRLAQPHPLDREWARAIQLRVSDRLTAEYAAAGKLEHYLTLRHHLTSEKSERCYQDDAGRLGRSVPTVRSDVARMRRRDSELLIEELRRESPNAEIKQELFHYFRVITVL